MRPKAEFTSYKSKAYNLIALGEFLLKFPSNDDSNYISDLSIIQATENAHLSVFAAV